MDKVSDVVERLRGRGFKITPQRIAIIKTLQKKNQHPSAEIVYNKLRIEFPSLSLTTVYKTLDILCELGELKEIYISGERVLYDTNSSPHHHLICKRCLRIIDIPEILQGKLNLPTSYKEKFEITTFQVDFYGYCARCRKIFQ